MNFNLSTSQPLNSSPQKSRSSGLHRKGTRRGASSPLLARSPLHRAPAGPAYEHGHRHAPRRRTSTAMQRPRPSVRPPWRRTQSGSSWTLFGSDNSVPPKVRSENVRFVSFDGQRHSLFVFFRLTASGPGEYLTVGGKRLVLEFDGIIQTQIEDQIDRKVNPH